MFALMFNVRHFPKAWKTNAYFGRIAPISVLSAAEGQKGTYSEMCENIKKKFRKSEWTNQNLDNTGKLELTNDR